MRLNRAWIIIVIAMTHACASAEPLVVRGSDDADTAISDLGDESDPTVDDSVEDTDDTPGDAPDYRDAGPVAHTTWDGERDVGSCTMAFTAWQPDEAVSDALVVLSHGFVRNRGHVADLAGHLASWGVQVVTPNLCHASAFDTDHAQNAVDLVALGEALAPASAVAYAGHSAGGLAALLAAAEDAGALGALGLDPVDSADLGATAAPTVSSAAHALVGDPSVCNADGNGVSMFGAVADGLVVRIPGADHCDFEGPTDIGCTLVCGGEDDQLSEEIISDAVRAMATAWVLWQTEADVRAAQWWTPGEGWFDQLAAAGVIEPAG